VNLHPILAIIMVKLIYHQSLARTSLQFHSTNFIPISYTNFSSYCSTLCQSNLAIQARIRTYSTVVPLLQHIRLMLRGCPRYVPTYPTISPWMSQISSTSAILYFINVNSWELVTINTIGWGDMIWRCDDCSLTRNLRTCAFVEVRNWGASHIISYHPTQSYLLWLILRNWH